MSKKKSSRLETIYVIINIILPIIAWMFIWDWLINDWNLYATISVYIVFSPLLIVFFLWITGNIIEKIRIILNKNKQLSNNNTTKNNDLISKILDALHLIDLIWLYFSFGFFWLIIMIIGFRDWWFESVKTFLRNMWLLILAILIRWWVLKIIKTIFRCSYAVALCILVLLSWIVWFWMMYYKETEEKNNAYYIDIKYWKKIDVQYYESLSTFPSTFIQYAYYNDSREHLILKIDWEYYQWCNYPYSMRKDFKNANSYWNFFNQFIKWNEKYECE